MQADLWQAAGEADDACGGGRHGRQGGERERVHYPNVYILPLCLFCPPYLVTQNQVQYPEIEKQDKMFCEHRKQSFHILGTDIVTTLANVGAKKVEHKKASTL